MATISTKYIFGGDETRAIQIAGLGRHNMKVLKNLMEFQGLQQLSRTVSYQDGTVIKCSSLYGQDKIDIFAPPLLISGIVPEIEEVAPVEKVWTFKLYRDDDTTIRNGEGNITTPSGLLIDIWSFNGIYIWDEEDSGYAGLPPIRGTYNKYWSYNNKTKIWTYDDSVDWPSHWWKGTYNENTGQFTIQHQNKNISLSGLYWVNYSTAEPRYPIINPAKNAAVSTSIVDDYIGIVVGLTETGNPQVLQPPTDKTAGRTFIVKLRGNNRGYTITINGIKLADEEQQGFTWNGESWETSDVKLSYGLNTQYPYRYKNADKEQSEDKINIGIYEGNIPYWEKVYKWSHGAYLDPAPLHLETSPVCDTYTEYSSVDALDNRLYYTNGFTLVRQLKTSIPYYVEYMVRSDTSYLTTTWFGVGKDHCDDEEYICEGITYCNGSSSQNDKLIFASNDDAFSETYTNLKGPLSGINMFYSSQIQIPASVDIEAIAKITATNNKFTNYCYSCTLWEDSQWVSYKFPTTLNFIRTNQRDTFNNPAFTIDFIYDEIDLT